MNKKLQLFLLQLVCHITLIYAIFNFTLSQWLTSFFIYFLTGCLGVSVTLHRYYSHKGFEFKYKWVERLCAFFAFYGVIGDPIAWVNNHRHHHRMTDKEGDPHSPKVYGFWRVQWFSMFYSYDKLRYVPNMVRDKYLVFLHKYYYVFHWGLMALLIGLNFDVAATIYLVPAAILWNAGSFVNTLGHMLGYKNHNTDDSSVNNPILGYFVWGEGWHNNHHNSPASSKFGERWFEFDMGLQMIKLIGVDVKV